MRDNEQLLYDALGLAIADKKFMGNNTKVDKAIEALTPKSTLTATFKRLQGNALSDYSVNKEKGVIGYNDETKATKIKSYIQGKFQSYLDDSKTSEEATKLFNAAYPPKAEEKVPEGSTAD